jgi:molybdopterin-guanine dinucleotide biosynthesis protein A
MSDQSGWVLVGGNSSRFGQDKAFAEWRGRPMTLHVSDLVRAATGSVTLVGDPQKYSVLGLSVIPDSIRGIGPIGGLLAALDATSTKRNLVVACDMPHLSKAFMRFLLERARDSGADVVLPVDADGLPQPLCAVYATTARESIQIAVKNGERKLVKTFHGLQVERITAKDYASFNKYGNLFANVNYIEDLSAD